MTWLREELDVGVGSDLNSFVDSEFPKFFTINCNTLQCVPASYQQILMKFWSGAARPKDQSIRFYRRSGQLIRIH